MYWEDMHPSKEHATAANLKTNIPGFLVNVDMKEKNIRLSAQMPISLAEKVVAKPIHEPKFMSSRLFR